MPPIPQALPRHHGPLTLKASMPESKRVKLRPSLPRSDNSNFPREPLTATGTH